MWILCSGSAALGRLGALSLHAAHATVAVERMGMGKMVEKIGKVMQNGGTSMEKVMEHGDWKNAGELD